MEDFHDRVALTNETVNRGRRRIRPRLALRSIAAAEAASALRANASGLYSETRPAAAAPIAARS
ncbi:MAG: hypothetical protein MUC34_19030, partial [Anaerolineae bacterium]|nr:hypothetical protein [Anaerolineae bacterium]